MEKILNANGFILTGRLLDVTRSWAKSDELKADSFYDGDYEPNKPAPLPQGGFQVVESEEVPRDQVWVTTATGEVLAKIVNLHVTKES